MNRKDSLVTLDELKQRILITRPFPRTLVGSPEEQLDTRASLESVQTLRPANLTPVPDNYIPSAVTIPAPSDSKDSKTGLARYFSMKRNNSRSSTSSQHRPVSSADSLTFSPALNYLIQGSDSRASIMKDIDEIISSYQGLHVDGDKRDTWAVLNGGDSKRDTLAILNGGDNYKRDTIGLNRDALQMLRNLPPTPEEVRENSEYPALNHNLFNQQQQYSQHMAAPKPLPQRPTQNESRWSAWSRSSSVYSDTVPPSLYSQDSKSSHESSVSPDLSPRASSIVPFPPFDPLRRPPSPPAPPFATPQRPQTPPYAPFAAPQRIGTPPIAPFAAPQRPQTPIKDDHGALKAGKTRVHLVPDQGPSYSSSSSSSTVYAGPSALGSSAAAVIAATALPPPPPPKPTPVRGHARSNSWHNTSIRTDTIQGPTTAQEAMMSGRPCKENNYWGFCKGAWGVREEVKRGLGLQTRPDGMYNTHQIWQCKHCHFQGTTFTAPHPVKKNKTETVVDPNVYTSAVGIRYKWVFLAKSHVKKKTMESGRLQSIKEEKEECNYGCLICSVEGNVTGIYGNVETLMNHIFLEHTRTMSDRTLSKARCILGRSADKEEDWDINIPMTDVFLA